METKPNRKFVVLFQSDISETDNKYVKLLNDSGISAKNIPTLSFNFINQEKLRSCLLNANDYSGIIFTSTRAVNAVASVLTPTETVFLESWKEKNNFSVGKATSNAALSLLNLKTCGSDTGNSDDLCKFILDKHEQYKKAFIFPCSNIRKNTVPDILSQHGIQIKEIVCYETVPNIHFNDLWKSLVLEKGLPEILIFFSPSGVQNCSKIVQNSYSDTAKPKFVAIGPSTEKTLLEFNINPDKVAEKPNPESVLKAVKTLLNN